MTRFHVAVTRSQNRMVDSIVTSNKGSIISLSNLWRPEFLDADSSNICISNLNSDKIIVGNEKGCYTLCIDSNSDITELKKFRDREVVSICDNKEDKNVFFIASEKSVYSFDVRISLDNHLHCFSDNIDELNQIKVNKSGQLAACDDAGEAKIYDTKTNSVIRTLRRKHTNICSSVSFIHGRDDELITGGLDSHIFHWDYRRVKVLQDINTQTLLSQLGDDSVYMFNPPLVYCLDVTADGNILASGLANGSVQLFKILKGKRGLAANLLINSHSTVGVSALRFVEPVDPSSSQILVSGGNDGIVNLWKLPVESSIRKRKQPPVKNKMCTEEEIESMLISRVDTKSKVNYIDTFLINNERIIFIADQTSSVKYFKFHDNII